jgi:acyl transferase domain-containing protein
MTIRTACSSSLVALHEAVNAIRSGDCDSAIVAGANLLMTPTMTMAMAEQGVLSPEGISKSFDASADGYARGEGIAVVFLKPLKDAIKDGDPIRSVIRSTATNNDGKTPGISMPSSEAHEAMIRHAYKIAGITDFTQTGFVECHATGIY